MRPARGAPGWPAAARRARGVGQAPGHPARRAQTIAAPSRWTAAPARAGFLARGSSAGPSPSQGARGTSQWPSDDPAFRSQLRGQPRPPGPRGIRTAFPSGALAGRRPPRGGPMLPRAIGRGGREVKSRRRAFRNNALRRRQRAGLRLHVRLTYNRNRGQRHPHDPGPSGQADGGFRGRREGSGLPGVRRAGLEEARHPLRGNGPRRSAIPAEQSPKQPCVAEATVDFAFSKRNQRCSIF